MNESKDKLIETEQTDVIDIDKETLDALSDNKGDK